MGEVLNFFNPLQFSRILVLLTGVAGVELVSAGIHFLFFSLSEE